MRERPTGSRSPRSGRARTFIVATIVALMAQALPMVAGRTAAATVIVGLPGGNPVQRPRFTDGHRLRHGRADLRGRARWGHQGVGQRDRPHGHDRRRLSTQVHAVADRGLLGLAVDPHRRALSLRPLHRGCPAGRHGALLQRHLPALSRSGAKDGCPAAGRLSRIAVGANSQIVGEQVLIGGDFWCHQQQGHAVDHLEFGPDGALYASSGDGATASFTDQIQRCRRRDRGAERLWRPARGGRLATEPADDRGRCASRSAISCTSGDPAQERRVIRIDPDTGAAMADNLLTGNGIASDDRHVAYGLRNPFLFTFRPERTSWVGDVG